MIPRARNISCRYKEPSTKENSEKHCEQQTQLKQTHLTQHKIDVQGHEPIKQRYYHISPKVREKINEEIDKMSEQGIIETSCSDWSNPIVMINKPN